MLVFNLTHSPLDFHGKLLAPDGGSLDFPELDKFIPNADKRLDEDGVISLGYLPVDWEMKNRPPPATPEPKKEEVPPPAPKPVFDRPSRKSLRQE